MLTEAFELFKIHYTIWFIIAIFFDEIILSIFLSYLIVIISEGEHNLIPLYLLLTLFSPLFSVFIIQGMTTKLASDIRFEFQMKYLNKYNSMSFESKNTKPSTLYQEISEPASHSLYTLIEWGLPNVMNLIGTMCSVIWVFFKKDMLLILIGIILFSSATYYHLIRKKQNDFTLLDKTLKKINRRLYSKIQHELIPFQFKEYKPSHILEKVKKINDNNIRLNIGWQQIIGCAYVMNKFICVLVGYFVSNDVSSFMLLLLTMNKLNNAINGITCFATQYNRIRNDYTNFEEFWNKAIFMDEPIKFMPTKDLKITHVLVDRENFKVNLDQNCKFISLAPGEKIYIGGKTGGGKTTFVRAMLGLIKGAKMNKENPENYYHYVVDYFQEIKEKFVSSKITIRDYFKGDKSDIKIEEYLLKVFEKDELDRIKKTFLSKYNNKKTPSPYDIEIDERISGGQKSRLILTQRLYEADTASKGILILDEPCPDVDHDTYIKIMNSLFENYKHFTIIYVGHLCLCKKNQLNKHFTQQLIVKDGLVTKI